MEVHSPGAMRPDASQPVAGVLQPELSEQEPCNMDVTRQDDALDDTVHEDDKGQKDVQVKVYIAGCSEDEQHENGT